MRRFMIVVPFLILVASAGLALADSPTATGSRLGRLTAQARPNPITAGEAVMVFGRLTGPKRRDARVVLWHKLAGWRRFHPATSTPTNAAGRYEILRRPNVVRTNRAWFVIAAGRRSRTMSEYVYARVSLSASSVAVAPGEAVTLSGYVAPSHRRQRILLRQRFGARWVTIARPRLDHASSFHVSHTFRSDGIARVRAVLPADQRNLRSRSPVISIDVNVIHKIKHVVVIMQENRSFDQYFAPSRVLTGFRPACASRTPRTGAACGRFTTPPTRTSAAPTVRATRPPTSTAAR